MRRRKIRRYCPLKSRSTGWPPPRSRRRSAARRKTAKGYWFSWSFVPASTNNLAWSKMLEESGRQVIYGAEGFKCHSKICLITLRNRNKTSYLTQIGTGNYNEKTNAMYTDLSLMTADQTIREDAAAFFRNMLVNKLAGEYKKLCVSPFGIKDIIANYLITNLIKVCLLRLLTPYRM